MVKRNSEGSYTGQTGDFVYGNVRRTKGDSGASLLVSTSLLALKIQILILSVTMECDSEKPVFSLSWSSVLF